MHSLRACTKVIPMAETVRRISVMLSNCQCLHWKKWLTSRASSRSLLAQMYTSLVW